MTRSIADLLFRPRGVVVYGASSDPDKLSGRPLAYLSSRKYDGQVYAINPRRDEVQGYRTFPDAASLPEPVDLAVVVVPAPAVVAAVRDCADAGVGAAIIFASGFAESQADDAIDQVELAAIVEATGIRVLGPNCLGSFALPGNVFATFSTAFDEGGEVIDSPVALVSQSGAVGTFTYSMMSATGIGIRYYANTGNQADVTAIEVLSELVDAPDVDILMGHLEDGTDLERLGRLAAAAEAARKPLLVLKGGSSAAGARAVKAHTASTAGDDAEVERVLAAHGAIRVPTMEAWADAALVLAPGRRSLGRRLTIMTQSGGSAALAADYATDAGFEIGTWGSAEDTQVLASRLPSFASVSNPIDLTGAMINDISLLELALETVLAQEGTDLVLVVLGNSDRGGDEFAAALSAAYQTTDKPVVVSWTGGSGRPRQRLLEAGIPTYTEPLRAVRALAHLARPRAGAATSATPGR